MLRMRDTHRFFPGLTRRRFLSTAAGGGMAVALPLLRSADNPEQAGEGTFEELSRDLLRDW